VFASEKAAPKWWTRRGRTLAPTVDPPPAEADDAPGDDIAYGLRCSAKTTRTTGEHWAVVLRFRAEPIIDVDTGFAWHPLGEEIVFTVPAMTLGEISHVNAVLFEKSVDRHEEMVSVDRSHPTRWTFAGKTFGGICMPHSPAFARSKIAAALTAIDEALRARDQATIDLRKDDFGASTAAQVNKALVAGAAWIGWADGRIASRVARAKKSDEVAEKRFEDAFAKAFEEAEETTTGPVTIDSVKCEAKRMSAAAPWDCDLSIHGAGARASGSVLTVIGEKGSSNAVSVDARGKGSFHIHPIHERRALLRVRAADGAVSFVRLSKLG
jgi:hypothetical protein